MFRFLPITIFLSFSLTAQELYPFTEPASNMPAKSLAIRTSGMFGKGIDHNRYMQRYFTEGMVGINKNWMVHAGVTFSDMQDPTFGFESVRAYTKYRFFSRDQVGKHLRFAAFAAAAYSRNYMNYNEPNLMGDHSGVQVGVIGTKLWDRFALSASTSLIELLTNIRWLKVYPQQYSYEAMNHSLSMGYLLLPFEYTSYEQTNVNLYLEILAANNLDWKYEKYYVDLAPAIQFIFNSSSKLNIGYRFQVSGDILRSMENSWMVSFEYLFLNAIK